MIKSQISRRMVSSVISDVVSASVPLENTSLKKMIMLIIIMNKSQEMTIFSGYQKLTSAMIRVQKSDGKLLI